MTGRKPIPEPKSGVTTDLAPSPADSLPAMQRLLTPVNAGMSAARHLLWYLSYHARPERNPAD